MEGQPRYFLLVHSRFGMDRCLNGLCWQLPTIHYVSKFLAVECMPVGAGALKALHKALVCSEARYLSISSGLMRNKPICCCSQWVLVVNALKLSEPALRQNFLIT